MISFNIFEATYESKEDKAPSIKIIWLSYLYKARARAILARCPPDRVIPISPVFVKSF